MHWSKVFNLFAPRDDIKAHLNLFSYRNMHLNFVYFLDYILIVLDVIILLVISIRNNDADASGEGDDNIGDNDDNN